MKMRPKSNEPVSGNEVGAGAATRDVRHTLLWFGIFGGPAAWSLQLLINYPVMAHACYPGKLPLSAPASGHAWAIAVTVNSLMILVALAAGATSISTWRQTRTELAGPKRNVLEDRLARSHFMAYAGILVSVLFLFALIMSAMPLFIVPACSYGA